MFNKVFMVGNLTRDIELRYSQNGSAIAKTAIATSHKFKVNGEKREETCFIDITFFGKSGEIANQYLRKGSKVLIEGRLQFEQWVDQQSGQKRSKHSVIVESMQMLDSKPQPDSGYQMPEASYEDHPDKTTKHTDYQPKSQPKAEMPKNTLPEIDIDEDEIPF